MNIRLTTTFAVLLIVAASLVSAAEDVQWVRVTVLLEPGSGGNCTRQGNAGSGWNLLPR